MFFFVTNTKGTQPLKRLRAEKRSLNTGVTQYTHTFLKQAMRFRHTFLPTVCLILEMYIQLRDEYIVSQPKVSCKIFFSVPLFFFVT